MAEDRDKPVKIAVVGDSQVGKTSLVIALTNESFPDVCPPVVPPASLPADFTPEGVPFHVLDTSSRPEERSAFEQTCMSADVVVLLFEAGSRRSLKRIGSHWMPLLKTLGVHVPVVMVSSKQDLSQVDNDELEPIAEPIMRKFQQIDTCLECSAKQLVNVAEVFYHALKAVVNPIAPLFDAQADNGQGGMRPLCIKALKRIFILNDKDKDGALSDSELNTFQVHCFSAPLQPEELSGLKKVVADQMQRVETDRKSRVLLYQGVNGAGLTLAGFLFLHALFIERGRLETVWAVLRTYGYNNDLRLNADLLSEVNFNHTPDQIVEMTGACQEFFGRLFVDFDKDKDQLLNKMEQADLFSTAPEQPWDGDEYRTLLVSGDGQEEGALTKEGFLSKWAYTTAKYPVQTLAYLRYLGYQGSAASFFTTSKPRKQERKQDQIQRSVLQVAVVLAKGAGKGMLLRGIAGTSEAETGSVSNSISAAAGQVSCEGSMKTLILYEQDKQGVSELERDKDSLAAMDLAAFTFNSSSLESFKEAHELLQRVAQASGNSLPCILVAIEDGKGMHESVIRECATVCASLHLRQPVTLYSDSLADVAEVFAALLQAAMKPEKALAIPLTPSLKTLKKQQEAMRRTAFYTLGGLAGVAICYVAYRAYQSIQASSIEANDISIPQRTTSKPVLSVK